ncbi:MAG TPA: hypothetical protein VFB72_12250 [Verrucomicrobiae bacterium]|nr:hypothetical protein [Verrucomicrobiae bacterium]
MKYLTTPSARFAVGLVCGAGISAVDNFAFKGEVSPIIIVALLLVAAASVGAIWGRRALPAVLAIWACHPLAHVFKHALNLPDTLHPNTYGSILILAIFSLVVTAIGAGCGLAMHRLIVSGEKSAK